VDVNTLKRCARLANTVERLIKCEWARGQLTLMRSMADLLSLSLSNCRRLPKIVLEVTFTLRLDGLVGCEIATL